MGLDGVGEGGEIALAADERREPGGKPRHAGGSRPRRHVRGCSARAVEDRAFEPLQLRTRGQTELLGENPTGALKRAKRLGLLAASVLDAHQQRPPALLQRLGRNQRLQLGGGILRVGSFDKRFEPPAPRGSDHLRQPRPLGGDRAHIGEIGQRLAANQRLRRCMITDGDQPLELVDVGRETGRPVGSRADRARC